MHRIATRGTTSVNATRNVACMVSTMVVKSAPNATQSVTGATSIASRMKKRAAMSTAISVWLLASTMLSPR